MLCSESSCGDQQCAQGHCYLAGKITGGDADAVHSLGAISCLHPVPGSDVLKPGETEAANDNDRARHDRRVTSDSSGGQVILHVRQSNTVERNPDE